MNNAMFPEVFVRNIKKFAGDSIVVCNRKILQQLVSNVCGEYAVYFIREMAKTSFKSVLGVFSENLKKNDDFVFNYFKKL